ncbi:hypothetical protein LTR37_008310 [Vermiconidia calcicola]|uniref:Uncharacterized protein n=1 Tax=Vermiconidia calcicola TaxID=1690605 RepID=A0ACC3NBB2_9PEZI|nr:hypothetical protein LTR37_008310 [Vermiconidia calcicola]
MASSDGLEKSPPRYDGGEADNMEKSRARRKSSVVNPDVLTGEIYDERFDSTKRGLKSRHAQMIALRGTIGTGLFVGSGFTLSIGGPAFILGSYIFMALLVWCIVTGISEVVAWLPTKGSSMSMFGWRYVSRPLGFAMGWLYWYSLGILVPYEITAAGLVIDYWHADVNIAVWISIIIVLIVGLNCLPVKYYGETEFWFAGTKVIMMTGLLILSFILFWGGGPDQHGILGFRYWDHPGTVNVYLEKGSTGRFCALLYTLVLSAFPFTFAPELLVATGGEMESPRRNLPTAARRYFYRLVIFYIGCVLSIGVLAPYNDPALAGGGAGAKSSGFVVGITNAGIPVLSSIINAGIIISAWSSGNSFLYLSSRSLYSLALTGNAPSWFKGTPSRAPVETPAHIMSTACSKSGVPYRAVAVSALYTGLAYLNVANSGSTVFTWFVSLTNTSGFISWVCCTIVYLRFRKACKTQGITDDQLPYHNKYMQLAMAGFIFLTLINGFNAFWPENWSASSFLTSYIGIPIFLLIYFGHRIYARNEPCAHDPRDVDLQTGMEEILSGETPHKVYDKWWKKAQMIYE